MGITTRSATATPAGAPSSMRSVAAWNTAPVSRSESHTGRGHSARLVSKRSSSMRAANANAAVSNAKRTKITSQPTSPLLSLDPECVFGTFQCRPSKRNRSPYVCDVYIDSLQRSAIAHLPNLDMGGKCRSNVRMLLKPARDKKGKKIGPDAVNPKYGTPKSEFIAQLVLVDDNTAIQISDSGTGDGETDAVPSAMFYTPIWVGAHPSLGEALVDAMLQREDVPLIPDVQDIRRQVTLNTTSSETTRADFVLTHTDGTRRVVEVKTVVDTDYSNATAMDPTLLKGVFTNSSQPYLRTALFPWGQSKQKGPDNEPVVSSRAIKHIRELTKLVVVSVDQERTSTDDPTQATIVFLVIRGDADVFRPNIDACPSFARYLKEAHKAGVQILVPRVRWKVSDSGKASCHFDGMLDIQW